MEPLPAAFAATRRSLHRVAEHVMAAASYAAIGKIGLRPHPGGFRTQEFGGGALVVEGATLDGTPLHGATLEGLGGRAGAELPYAAETPFNDEPLDVDDAAARALGNWFQFVAAALPAPGQLWPEHFDLAVDVDRVNFGGSPGDDTHPEPYLYVGPWDGADGARFDPATFDDPWGYTLHYRDIRDLAHAKEFFAR